MSNDHNDTQSATDPTGFVEANGAPWDLSGNGHLGPEPHAVVAVRPQSLLNRDDAPAVDDKPKFSAPLEFRVIKPGGPVRRLRLTGKRYTFGSGEGCSIQLDDPTLRAMHAVLLRDTRRVLLRAYSVPIECNGARVTESTLRIGDIIRMGSYRFELLSGAPTDSAAARPVSPGNKEIQLRERLADLSQQWHVRHAECEIRESRCDQRESELHGRETELWSRAESLQRRESLLIAQETAVREIQETYQATQAELRELRTREVEASEALQEKEAELVEKSEQLRQRQAELQQRQAEWQQREEQYAENAAEAQRKLEQAQHEAQSASDAVVKMRDEFAELNDQLTALRERHSELQQREQQEQDEHQRLREELEQARDEAVLARENSDSERAAVAEAFARTESQLDATRQELDEVRRESEQCQSELNDRLKATTEKLHLARQEAVQSRREVEEDQAYSEKRIEELEQLTEELRAGRAEEEAEKIREIGRLESEHAHAEKKRLEAEQIAESLRATIAELSERQSSEQSEQENSLGQIEQLQSEKQAAEQARQQAQQSADELRGSIEALHQEVAEANQRADDLKAEYESAQASIRQLELLVDQTKNNQLAQQDSWTHESEHLQETIGELSIQLSAANAELLKLRASNEALSDELDRSRTERDQAIDAKRETVEMDQFRILEEELESARDEIERLRTTHDETVSRLQTERDESETALRDEIEQLRQEIADAQVVAHKRIDQLSAADQPIDQPGDEQSIEPAGEPAAELNLAAESADLPASGEADTSTESVDDSVEKTTTRESAFAFVTGQDEPPEPDAPAEDSLPESNTHSLSSSAVSESIQQDGENVWRAEAQQDVSGGSHLDGWSDESDCYDENEQDQQTRTGDDEASWTDEPPEAAIADAIEDIEHNVEQAMSDYSVTEDESLPVHIDPADAKSTCESDRSDEADNDDETPVDWSAFLPGNEQADTSWKPGETAGEPPAQETADADSLAAEDTTSKDSEDQNVEPPESFDADPIERTEIVSAEQLSEQSWSESPSWNLAPAGDSGAPDDVDAEPQADQDAPSLSGQEMISQWYGHEATSDQPPQSIDDDASESTENSGAETPADAAAPHLPMDDIGQSTGSLAEMLIQDLAKDVPEPTGFGFNKVDQISTPESDSSDESGEPDGNTFVMPEDMSPSHEGAGSQWNFSSPEPRDPVVSSNDLSSSIALTDDGPDDSSDESDYMGTQPYTVEHRAVDAEHDEDNSPYGAETADGLDSDDEVSAVTHTELSIGSETVSIDSPAIEDDSIEAYMSRLLQRVQHDPASISATSAAATSQSSSSESAESKSKENEDDSKENEDDAIGLENELSTATAIGDSRVSMDPTSVADSVPLVPRSQAPELKRDLSAMRDLANQSARNAVSRSIRIQARNTQVKALIKAAFAAAFIIMAIGVFIFFDLNKAIKIAMIGALLVLAGITGQEAFVLAREARRRLALAEGGTNESDDSVAVDAAPKTDAGKD